MWKSNPNAPYFCVDDILIDRERGQLLVVQKISYCSRYAVDLTVKRVLSDRTYRIGSLYDSLYAKVDLICHGLSSILGIKLYGLVTDEVFKVVGYKSGVSNLKVDKNNSTDFLWLVNKSGLVVTVDVRDIHKLFLLL